MKGRSVGAVSKTLSKTKLFAIPPGKNIRPGKKSAKDYGGGGRGSKERGGRKSVQETRPDKYIEEGWKFSTVPTAALALAA